jgi:hypothetical protein
MSSGFSGIIGFIFTFMVIMAMFISVYYIFIANVATQEDLFRDNTDQTVQTLREEFDISNMFLNSGRIVLDIDNLGKDELKFKSGYSECFEYFIGETYVTDNNIDLKTGENLGGNYYFIPSGDNALVYLFYNSIIAGSETVRLVSCLGNVRETVVLDENINWFDNDYLSRERLSLGLSGVDRENEVISHSLTSANYNTTFFENSALSYSCPVSNFEILNLPLDDFSQNLKDYSIKDETVTLGNDGSIEAVDPSLGGGVILKGLDFTTGDFAHVNNFEFDDGKSTISFWFKSNFTLDSSSVKRTFFNVGNEYFVGHNYNGDGEIGFYRYNGAAKTFEITSLIRTFGAGEWYNIIIVLDNSNLHKLFINGVLDTSSGSNLNGNTNSGLTVGLIEG